MTPKQLQQKLKLNHARVARFEAELVEAKARIATDSKILETLTAPLAKRVAAAEANLKSCPFCGSAAKFFDIDCYAAGTHQDKYPMVHCSDLECFTFSTYTEEIRDLLSESGKDPYKVSDFDFENKLLASLSERWNRRVNDLRASN